MENNEGRLFYGASLDTSQMRSDAQEAHDILHGIGQEAQEIGQKMDESLSIDVTTNAPQTMEMVEQAFGEIDRVIDTNMQAIRELDEEYVRLGAKAGEAFMKGTKEGDAEYRAILNQQKAVAKLKRERQAVIAVAREQAKEVKAVADALEKQKKEAEGAAQGQESLRGQIKALKEEMARLRLEGIDEQSAAYKNLVAELGRLQDIQGDIQKQGSIMSNDENQFAGVISGIQGVTGAFTAASGAAALFGSKNENLQLVMTKLQALMTITMGLQQVQQTLNKDSAFQLVTMTKLKEWWNNLLDIGRGKQIAETEATIADIAATTSAATANAAEAAAKEGVTVASGKNVIAETADTAAKGANAAGAGVATAANITLAGAFRMVAAAIKSIPVIGWILAGVSALIGLISLFTSKSEEAEEQAKKLNEAQQDGAKAYITARMELNNYIEKLENFNGTQEQEKKIVKEVNTKYGEQLGYVKTVKEAKELLTSKGEAYCEMLKLEATAQALLNEATAAYINILKTKQKAEAGDFDDEWWQFWYWGGQSSAEKRAEAIANAEKDYQFWLSEYDKIRKKVTAYKSEHGLGGWIDPEAVKIKGNGNGGNSEAERAQRDHEKRLERIKQYGREEKKAYKQVLFDIAQAQIDAEKDAFKKRMMQADLNHQKALYDLELKKEELLEKYRDKKQAEWEEANPNAVKKGQKFDRDAVTLPKQIEQAMIGNYIRWADAEYKREQENILQELLGDIQTYEQKRLKVTSDYAAKRAALYQTGEDGKPTDKLRQGVTQGNLDELKRQEEEALAAVDQEFASRSEQFEAWCNEIGTMSLTQLEAVLKEAEAELQRLSNDPKANPEAVATARAKVKTAKDKISKAKAQNDISPNKRSIKEWEDLYGTLKTCEAEFEKIGQAVGGTAGEIISTAGQIASSSLQMINGIVTLANSSSAAMKGTAVAAAASISTVEKASVILTIISAALQIAMTIANLFNNDEDLQEEIEDLQSQIDQLQWEFDNQEIMRWQKTYGTALSQVNKAIAETRYELLRAAAASGDFWAMFRAASTKISADAQLLEKTAKKLADAYANMSYSADKAVGDTKFTSAREQLDNLAKQQIMIREQIDAEKDKKDTDWDKISDWEHQIEEKTQTALNLINGLMEDIIGGTSDEIANQLADAFWDAALEGEDAMEAWGNKSKEIVADVIKKMLVQEVLTSEIAKIFDKYKSKWFVNGVWQGSDVFQQSMIGLRNDLNNVYGVWMENFSDLPDQLMEMLDIGSEATREAASKGIAQASQESVDKLDGTATSIQGHTYSIMENTKLLLQTCNLILQNVIQIESHTDDMSSRMASVESDVRSVKNTLNDIALKGIKVK